MHSRELAELAALIAVHAPAVVQRARPVPSSCSEQYWAASKCRLDRWTRLLRQMTAAADAPEIPPTLAWSRVGPVFEEILVSELLTRLWTACSAAHDAARGTQELEPVARNIFGGHLDVRRRVLTILADERVMELRAVKTLNKLRRRVERWNDMLLAHVADMIAIDEFAFEPDRAREFADDLDHDAAHSNPRFTCQLVLVSLRASLAQGLFDWSPNSDLNRRIGSALVGAFPDELTETTSLVKSLWLQRLSQTASDTEGMVAELLRLDAAPR